MITTGHIEKLAEHFRLSPFQISILEGHGDEYDLEKLVKKGDVLYAPYSHDSNFMAKFLSGPRADLVGKNRILVRNGRGIKLYGTGFFSARDQHGHRYYSDPTGQVIDRKLFYRII
ncbi:MAG: hypothetical protein FWF97_01565 [Alphaproteobacteria bacterium]|nr:hypothetical protein [Alphaproteobacteria bacterium]